MKKQTALTKKESIRRSNLEGEGGSIDEGKKKEGRKEEIKQSKKNRKKINNNVVLKIILFIF